MLDNVYHHICYHNKMHVQTIVLKMVVRSMHWLFISQCDAAASVAPSFSTRNSIFNFFFSSINDESPMNGALLMIEK